MFRFMTVARLLGAMEGLEPSRDAEDFRFRTEIATTISLATDDAREQTILARIAWFEARLLPRVAFCETNGQGSFGLFQVEPLSPDERGIVCGPLEGQTDLALARVRDSRARCAHLPPELSLAAYASGSCDRGHSFARDRWGPP